MTLAEFGFVHKSQQVPAPLTVVGLEKGVQQEPAVCQLFGGTTTVQRPLGRRFEGVFHVGEVVRELVGFDASVGKERTRPSAVLGASGILASLGVFGCRIGNASILNLVKSPAAVCKECIPQIRAVVILRRAARGVGRTRAVDQVTTTVVRGAVLTFDAQLRSRVISGHGLGHGFQFANSLLDVSGALALTGRVSKTTPPIDDAALSLVDRRRHDETLDVRTSRVWSVVLRRQSGSALGWSEVEVLVYDVQYRKGIAIHGVVVNVGEEEGDDEEE